MSRTDRRGFLQTTATVATACMAAPALGRSRLSPNDRIRVGLLGLGRPHAIPRRGAELKWTAENVEIVAVCDCDQTKLDTADKALSRTGRQEAGSLHRHAEDVRRQVDRRVSNALGDRWHALSTIWACQAGKDVYVEKPGTHNLFEGRQMVAAARKYERMVQHGTQNRSSPNIMEGIQKLKEGVDRRRLHGPRTRLQDCAATWDAFNPAASRRASTGTSGWAPNRCGPTANSGTGAGTGTGTQQRLLRQPGGARNGYHPLGAAT